MGIEKCTSLILLLLMVASRAALSSPAMSRKSPEFTITESSGKRILLSSFKGKVVMIEFLFLKSPKCLKLATTMNKLGLDLGARGFQPIAVAFPAPGSDANGPLVGYMVDYFKLGYPVGYADKNDVDHYLSRAQSEVLRIPQVVIIDRTGMIRAQTGGRDGTTSLEDEDFLRKMLDSLLKEGVSAGSTSR